MFLTFLLSACVHELVMAVVTQKIRYELSYRNHSSALIVAFRMYLFAMQVKIFVSFLVMVSDALRKQLVQIPLIAVGRIPAIKRNKLMGNVVFWVGLYAGFPLLCVAYCAY